MSAFVGRRQNRISVTVVAIVALFAIVASGCKSNDSKKDDKAASDSSSVDGNALVDEGEPQKGGKLVIGVTAETDGWNPGNATWADAGNFVGSSMFESLGVFTNTGEVLPWLAESWESSDDYKTWTIHVRKGIKTHAGTELTAQDVRDSLWLNATDGIAKVQFDGLILAVDVVDDYTVEVELATPWAVFYTVFGGISGYVMTSEMIESPMKGNGKRDIGAGDPLGTGPYKFQNWDRGVSLTVSAFEEYWGGPCALPDPGEANRKMCEDVRVPLGQPNGPFLESMEFRPIPDAMERATALRNGDVNMIMSTRTIDAAEFKGNYQVVKDYASEKTFIMVNTAQPPFDNIHARRALSYATNAEAIIKNIDNGEGIKRDTSPFGEILPLAVPADQTGALAFDAAKAREELELYKADTGSASLSFVLSGLDNVDDRSILQQVQEQWAEVGIESELKTDPQTAYLLKIVSGEFQAAYFRSYGFPEPDFNSVFFSAKTAKSTPVVNFSRYTSDTMEAALAAGRQTTDFETRKKAYEQVVHERNENALDVWLFNTPYALIAEKDVRGLNWFRVFAFGIYQPKPWVGGMWLAADTGT